MISIDSKCEAFDIAIALYNWCADNHEGMMSDKYSIMSTLISTYNMSNIPSIDDSTELYYNGLDESNYISTKQVLFDYLDSEWDDAE